jgi:hypothetical protein
MNTTPVFTLTPNISWATITAANTALDGTGSNVATCYTAGANGSWVNNVTIKSNTTTATSAAATFRIFINNGSTPGTATNNTLLREYTLTSVTAIDTGGTLNWEFPLNLQLPAGYKILCTIATVAGSSGFALTCTGADY